VARFTGSGDAYRGQTLVISRGVNGPSITVARADPYVRPVWSPDQRKLLFVTVRAARAIPGAAWTLHHYNRMTHRIAALASEPAMGFWPLGWRGDSIIYAVSNGSDTSLYAWSRGKIQFLSILVPQVVSAPSLSPDGARVAFLTPADCSYCALSIFELTTLTTWFGPAGVPSEYDVAWTADGRTIVTMLNGKIAAIDLTNHHVASYARPAGLPALWPHSMSAALSGNRIRLTDQTTGRVYTSRAAAA
jgi:hypothetical protein